MMLMLWFPYDVHLALLVAGLVAAGVGRRLRTRVTPVDPVSATCPHCLERVAINGPRPFMQSDTGHLMLAATNGPTAACVYDPACDGEICWEIRP
jgi:hypothetical protein